MVSPLRYAAGFYLASVRLNKAISSNSPVLPIPQGSILPAAKRWILVKNSLVYC